MHGTYRITMELWPYNGISNGKGAKGDQKMAGERVNTFTVEAQDMRDAFKQACLIQRGALLTAPVWEAPITSIVRVKD